MRVLFVALVLFLVHLKGESTIKKPLPELINLADHIIVSKIIKIDTIPYKWVPSNDSNIMYRYFGTEYCCTTNKDGVLETTLLEFPQSFCFVVWRYGKGASLTDLKKRFLNNEYITLLKGGNLEIVYGSGFLQSKTKLKDIQDLVKEKQYRNK